MGENINVRATLGCMPFRRYIPKESRKYEIDRIKIGSGAHMGAETPLWLYISSKRLSGHISYIVAPKSSLGPPYALS